MANLLKYWLNSDNIKSIPEVQINIRGANKFGLDLIDVVHDKNHIFRITADGKVYIHDKLIT
jgi:hypothetical protein